MRPADAGKREPIKTGKTILVIRKDTMIRDALFIGGWLVCAVLVCGIFTADSQAKSHYPGEKFREDLGFGLAFGLLFGPFGLELYCFLLQGLPNMGCYIVVRNQK